MNITQAINHLLGQFDELPWENMHSLTVSGDAWPENSSQLWQTIQTIHQWLVTHQLGECLVSGYVSGTTDLNMAEAEIEPGDRWTFSIDKNCAAGTTFFFTLEGFERSLIHDKQDPFATLEKIKLCDQFQPFSTYQFTILPIEAIPFLPNQNWSGEDNPRLVVRTFAEAIALPHRVSAWLPIGPVPADHSPIYQCWRRIAIAKLGLVLPHEIIQTESKTEGIEATLKGPRKLKVAIEANVPESPQLFEQLVSAVRWVYESTDHLTSRHDLLIHHLVVEWVTGETWFQGLANHLEEAKRNAADSFRFYLAGETKEVLSSLANLRKAMFDEVSQVSRDVTELVSTLWKDLTLIVGAALINLIPKGVAIQSPEIIYRVVVIFILTHFLFRVSTSLRKQNLSRQEREEWRKRLFKYIEETDYKNLVEKPIQKHLLTFRISAILLFLLYIFLAVSLWNPPDFLVVELDAVPTAFL